MNDFERAELLGIEVETHATGTGHAAQEAVAGELFVDAQHALLESHRVHVRADKRHIRANRADIGDMVVKPFQFEAKRAERAGTGRRLGVSGTLDGVAKSLRVREAGIAGNALREANAVLDGRGLEELLNALMHVKHPKLEVEHRLSRHAEQEVARLDDARMHRTD